MAEGASLSRLHLKVSGRALRFPSSLGGKSLTAPKAGAVAQVSASVLPTRVILRFKCWEVDIPFFVFYASKCVKNLPQILQQPLYPVNSRLYGLSSSVFNEMFRCENLRVQVKILTIDNDFFLILG